MQFARTTSCDLTGEIKLHSIYEKIRYAHKMIDSKKKSVCRLHKMGIK